MGKILTGTGPTINSAGPVSRSRFVRQDAVSKMWERVSNYKRFRELVNKSVDVSLELEEFERAQEDKDGHLWKLPTTIFRESR